MAASPYLGNSGSTLPVSAGFEVDETLGRLQFVANILPESTMVFLSGEKAPQAVLPSGGRVSHEWTKEEPWLEYSGSGQVESCMAGEVMTVIKNRQDAYTVRIMHDGGYESVYSGLDHVQVEENNTVDAGETIGTAPGFTAFELRRDGLSVLPVFHAD